MCKTVKTQIANILTLSRIIGSLILIWTKTFSLLFYSCYVFCGLTDMIDGTVARKTHSVSEFGKRLDSIADFIFICVCLIKILPAVNLHLYVWIWIGIITLIKMVNLFLGLTGRRKEVFLHSAANKITGFLLFLLPFTMPIVPLQYAAIPVCIVATFAAVQEGILLKRKGGKYAVN